MTDATLSRITRLLDTDILAWQDGDCPRALALDVLAAASVLLAEEYRTMTTPTPAQPPTCQAPGCQAPGCRRRATLRAVINHPSGIGRVSICQQCADKQTRIDHQRNAAGEASILLATEKWHG